MIDYLLRAHDEAELRGKRERNNQEGDDEDMRTFLLRSFFFLGTYHALMKVSERYSKASSYLSLKPGLFSGNLIGHYDVIMTRSFISLSLYLSDDRFFHLESLPNPIAAFFLDSIPLTLHRMCSTAFASDLELHIDILRVIEHMSKKSQRALSICWLDVMKHLLRMLMLFNCVVLRKAAPIRVANMTDEGFSTLSLSVLIHL